MSLIEILQNINPKQGIIFAAIEYLTSSEDIRKFYLEYLPYLQEHGKSHLVNINPEEAARRNIAYCLSYYHKNVSAQWIGALPELKETLNEFGSAHCPSRMAKLAKRFLKNLYERL